MHIISLSYIVFTMHLINLVPSDWIKYNDTKIAESQSKKSIWKINYLNCVYNKKDGTSQ